MTLAAGFFDAMYAGSPDPWGFRTRRYEARKRAITLAALPQDFYERAFEPGCAIGMLTDGLAARCGHLLATDISEPALTQARQAVAGHPHVTVTRLAIPDEWPAGSFDLVVLSEVGYYLDRSDLPDLARRAAGSLAAGGTLLACHWRHPVDDYPSTGDEVHEILASGPELVRVVRHEEEDFLLDVWTRGQVPSPARREGLA